MTDKPKESKTTTQNIQESRYTKEASIQHMVAKDDHSQRSDLSRYPAENKSYYPSSGEAGASAAAMFPGHSVAQQPAAAAPASEGSASATSQSASSSSQGSGHSGSADSSSGGKAQSSTST